MLPVPIKACACINLRYEALFTINIFHALCIKNGRVKKVALEFARIRFSVYNNDFFGWKHDKKIITLFLTQAFSRPDVGYSFRHCGFLSAVNIWLWEKVQNKSITVFWVRSYVFNWEFTSVFDKMTRIHSSVLFSVHLLLVFFSLINWNDAILQLFGISINCMI